MSLMSFMFDRCDRSYRCRSCRSCYFYSILCCFLLYFDVVINIYNTRFFFKIYRFDELNFLSCLKFFISLNLHRFRTQFLYQRVQQKNVKMRSYFCYVRQNVICVVHRFFDKCNIYTKTKKSYNSVMFDDD